MLEVLGAAKDYNGRPVFSDICLAVPRGGFHVLIGPSGCGKSTLFDCMTGVVRADDGRLLWRGRQVSDLSSQAAYMQQKDMLLPWFSLMDNALLPARTGGQDMKAAKEQAAQLFVRLGLDGYESFYPSRVSGGMRQRCALVRTLMFNRELILLDEPLSALDTITRRSLQSLLLLLQTEFKKTILMITHDIEEALLLADKVYLLGTRPMAVARAFVLDSPKPRHFDDTGLLEIRAQMLERLEGDLVHEPG